MFKKMCVYLLGLAILCANVQAFNLQGVVSNSGGKPIADAIVTLVLQKMKDTTGTDGKYAFTTTSVKNLPAILPQINDISLKNDILQFAVSTPSPMKVEIFNLKGNLLRQEINMNAAAGTYRFDISKNCHAENVLVIKAAVGRSEISFKYMPLNGERYSSSLPNALSPISTSGGLAKMAAVVDTLTVTATGYQTKSIALTSLDNQQQNITLDSASSDYHYMGNPPGPSIGCGKTFNTLKSGTYTIKSSGTNRTYIIKIPSNYDKNNPYRLIFGMHCMGCDAATMAKTSDSRSDGAYNYYGLGTLATNAILVAPQGNSDGTWQGEPDRKFFSDMVKLFKDTLCIDTTRIFSCGFSFGAMFTYALSLEFPKILRAVACFAPANYAMDQPTNNHIPIAYFQTTGKSDGTCPWVNQDANKTGGKYCLLQHIQDNGCTVPTDIPLATGNTHVSTDFTCPVGYPVRFGSFNGGHTANSTENGVNWIPTETWNFFKQF